VEQLQVLRGVQVAKHALKSVVKRGALNVHELPTDDLPTQLNVRLPGLDILTNGGLAMIILHHVGTVVGAVKAPI
jgi:hypothetical protein